MRTFSDKNKNIEEHLQVRNSLLDPEVTDSCYYPRRMNGGCGGCVSPEGDLNFLLRGLPWFPP